MGHTDVRLEKIKHECQAQFKQAIEKLNEDHPKVFDGVWAKVGGLIGGAYAY